MPSPFPGMDPYLESPLLWHDVHQRLAAQISRQLAPRLAPRYVARLETRFVSSAPDEQTGGILYPDVDITSVQLREQATVTYQVRTGDADTVTPSPPLLLRVAPIERIRLVTVEIRDAAQNRLVTSIEILSPVNKWGTGLQEYRRKRETVFASEAHLLEIDLLRQGVRVPRLFGLPKADYFVFLTRAERGEVVETWPFGVRDPLPVVVVPLLPGDDDVPLDLGRALRTIYDEARYDLSIDYSVPPVPPLSDEDAEWAQTLDV